LKATPLLKIVSEQEFSMPVYHKEYLMWQGKLVSSLTQAVAAFPERSAFYDYNGANCLIA